MLDPTWLTVPIATLIAFVCGALPTAVWVGRLAGVDIQAVGDGNPGATNVVRAAGIGWGIVAFVTEFSKAAVPVGITYVILNWHGIEAVPIAIAPSLGHAFSPFLNWRGGKALASMLGAWIGLTLWVMPAILLTTLVLMHTVVKPKRDVWSVLAAIGCGFIWLVGFKQDGVLVAVLVLQLGLVLYTHRQT